MTAATTLSNAQSIVIAKPMAAVFAFMSDANNIDLWSFGTWHTEIAADGLISGRSLFDGALIYVRIQAFEAQGLIDYCIGTERDQLRPRIFVRLSPGDVTGLEPSVCLLSMIALRPATMSDARWQKLIAVHAVELELIKSRLETGYDPRMNND